MRKKKEKMQAILMGKRNITIEFCQVRLVVHKHKLQELTMTRTLSKASGMSANIYLKPLKMQLIQIIFFPVHINLIPFICVFTSLPNIQERFSKTCA